MDWEKIKKQIMDSADTHVRERMQHAIESQYCPVHGKFASMTTIEEDIEHEHQLRFGYKVCCDELAAQVKQALSRSE